MPPMCVSSKGTVQAGRDDCGSGVASGRGIPYKGIILMAMEASSLRILCLTVSPMVPTLASAHKL